MAYENLPPGAENDPFHPPSIATLVHCIHCHEEYDSWRIEWRETEGADGTRRGFWRCPIEGCDGAGFGSDIFPVDPNYVDPDGRDMGWFADDEEGGDDDGEDWADDDEDDDEEFEWADDDEEEEGDTDESPVEEAFNLDDSISQSPQTGLQDDDTPH